MLGLPGQAGLGAAARPLPDEPMVAREDLLDDAMVAWLPLPRRRPMNLRLVGRPGTDKDALTHQLARRMGRDPYALPGHRERSYERATCAATVPASGAIAFVASELFGAMLRGGICFSHELGKAPSSALEALTSVLDPRRMLDARFAGIKIRVHPDLLFCAALSENEEQASDIPEFTTGPTAPRVRVGLPPRPVLGRILRAHAAGASQVYVRAFLLEKGTELPVCTARRLLRRTLERVGAQETSVEVS